MAMPSPIEAFEGNLADAHFLVELAEALDNFRVRRARTELRERAGDLIGARQADYGEIDCIESQDFFLILKPGTEWRREALQDRRPLLRQAVVAGAAAFETFLADRVTLKVRSIMTNRGTFPPRLREVPMTVGRWREIEDFKIQWRKITDIVVGPHIREQSSTAPSQVGQLLSMVNVDKPLSKVDVQRKKAGGTTEDQLKRLTARRNLIAHEADRKGRGRATITEAEVRTMLDNINDVARAIDTLVQEAPPH